MKNIIIVGGGLAGLTAASFLAKAGYNVTVLEKASHVGGRAITQTIGDFQFNLGPHALYKAGRGAAILQELGLKFKAGTPPNTGLAIYQDQAYALPGDTLSLLTTRLINPIDKIEFARFFMGLPKIQTQPIASISLEDWLQHSIHRPKVREMIKALVRVATYANAPDLISAGVAIAQVQMALQGVFYLDGGWQTLVDGLKHCAEQHGAKVVTGCRVATVEHDETVKGVRLDGGDFMAADAVILATTSPATTSALLPDNMTLHNIVKAALPVRVACLDVALYRLPEPHVTFALGIDQPLYFSAHSTYAKLAPKGEAVVHVAKYLDPNVETDAKADESELENLLDLVHPGWRIQLIHRRFLPKMTVYNKLVMAKEHGLAGRPSVNVPEIKNLFVAGDWVGSTGLLADAAFVSAKQAALLAIAALNN